MLRLSLTCKGITLQGIGKKRQSRPPKRYGYSDLVSYALISASEVIRDEPLTYEEAVSSKDSFKWVEAMKFEINSLKKNETWSLVERPQGQRVVGCNRLCKVKEGSGENAKPRYKARIVARGFTQVPRLDFNEVCSPVVRLTSIRVLLAMTTQLNLVLEQMDVTTTFLHGELDERILME